MHELLLHLYERLPKDWRIEITLYLFCIIRYNKYNNGLSNENREEIENALYYS